MAKKKKRSNKLKGKLKVRREKHKKKLKPGREKSGSYAWDFETGVPVTEEG